MSISYKVIGDVTGQLPEEQTTGKSTPEQETDACVAAAEPRTGPPLQCWSGKVAAG